MKHNIISQSGHTSYGICDFVVDEDEGIKTLPTNIPMGSMALSINSGNVFILNSQREWINSTNNGGNS